MNKYKVIWSLFAEQQLDLIYNFYLVNVGQIIAKRIVTNIVLETEKLSKSAFIGPIEELLLDRSFEYRYLIYSNYKIIYTIDASNLLIKVSDVFDTRQNPQRIVRYK